MRNDSLFRRNLVIIAVLHVVLVAALWLGGVFSSKKEETVTWLDGGSISQAASGKKGDSQPDSTPEETPEATPAPRHTPDKDPDKINEQAPSEIVLSTPTPRQTPTPTPTPRPTPKPTPTPTPTPVETPKPTPKPTPKLTPKPTPKPTPKRTPTPKATPKKPASPSASPKKPSTAKPVATGNEDASPTPKSHRDTDNGDGGNTEGGPSKSPGTSSSPGKSGKNTHGDGDGPGHEGGSKANTAAMLGLYHSMIHDRFYSQWQQPASIVESGAKLSSTINIRIEKNGHISDVSLEKTSGNAIMDESVMSAAHRVTQIDPLPSVIKDNFYVVRIELELTPN